MKKILFIIVGFIGGFIGGIILSEIISIIGVLLFDRPIWLRWLKYFPFVTAIAGAVVVPMLFQRRTY